jgi:prepilin-type N-terminal cleavage/methylation domain-containing protein
MHAPRGFTLIEVVIAIFLVGLLAVLTANILTATPLATHAKEEQTALAIASNRMEALRAGGYAALPASGPFSDASLANLPGGSGEVTVSTYNSNTKEVTVTVSWNEDGTPHDVVLTTLVTEIGGLP